MQIDGLYDEDYNLLTKNYGFATVDENDELREYQCWCSYCFKHFARDRIDIFKMAKKHAIICNFHLGVNGVNVFSIKDFKDRRFKKREECFNKLAYISKREQELDFSISDIDSMIKNHQTSFVFIEERKPLGILTVYEKEFRIENWRGEWIFEESPVKFLNIADFAVVNYMQRKGVGKKLFDYMLDHYKLDIQKIVFNDPSEKTFSFLKKWYNLDRSEIIAWR